VAFAEVNGQRLRYEDTGGDGPPVVLSHGFLMNREMFAPQVADLSDVYRVVTWDARGFGETQFDGKPFDLWDSARDVFGLLDHIGIERAVIGGLAQGGHLALRAALLQPDRVRALILIGTEAGTEPPDRLAEYRELVAGWSEHGYLEVPVSEVASQIIGDPELESVWKERWRSWDPSGLPTASAALLDRDDISDRIPELAMPVLLIHGTGDAAVPVSSAYDICEAVDDCRGVIEVQGATHAANLTHPEIVNPAVRNFLEGLPA
jgi:3-oxoadipate enol-lactonase